MLSHDGKPLSTVGSKRLEWYLSRGLAEEVDYPDKRYSRVIKLNFKNGNHGLARESDIEIVQNRCVICGATEDLSRHHVVPYRVKCTYPKRYKDHTRFQCVLVCGPHHALAEKACATLDDPYLSFTRKANHVVHWVGKGLGVLRRLYVILWRYKHGGIKGVNKRFIDAFMTLEPKYLPKGWLES